MTTIIATPVKHSWAQIVQGETKNDENTQTSIRPARRGSLLRFCRGEVLTMLSHYGWLMLHGDVDHPSVAKHGGDVYIHKDDVVDSESLSPGDIVTFYLYVDDQGLGAEECRVEHKAASHLNLNAAVFVPSDPYPASQTKGFSLNASAMEFVMPMAPEIAAIDQVADVFLRLSQVFSTDDEDEDEDEEEDDLDKRSEAKRAPSSDGSTYGGATSESEEEEEETSSEEASDSDTESSSEMLAVWTKRLPPGMMLPLHFRPPPGL